MYRFKNIEITNKSIILFMILEIIFFTIGSIILEENILIVALASNLLLMVSYFLLRRDDLLIILAISSSLIVTFLSYNLGINKSINYILDYFIILILIKSTVYFILRKIKFRKIYIFFIIFLIFSIISAIFNQVNIIMYMIGLYSDYLRYAILIFSIINFKLPESNIKKYIKFLWIFLLIQVPVVIFQNIYSKKYWYPKLPGEIRQDYISGLLGGRSTAELGAIICIALGCMFILYQNNKISIKYFIAATILLIGILVIAEIKFAFILFIIVFITISMIKPKFKNFIIISLSIVMVLIGIQVLEKLYPNFNSFFEKDTMIVYLETDYAGSNLNRLTSLTIANKEISKTGANKLLGFGVGTSGIKEMGTKNLNEFQKNNIYNFKMFTCSQYLIENGWIGFLCIYGILIYGIYMSHYLMKRGKTEFEKILGMCGIHSGIIIIMITAYLMSMVKINFAVIAWSLIGLIARYYYKTKSINNY